MISSPIATADVREITRDKLRGALEDAKFVLCHVSTAGARAHWLQRIDELQAEVDRRERG